MKRFFIFCLCSLLFLVPPVNRLNAKITLIGLEDDSELAQDITEKALAPYIEEPAKPMRFAKIKADIEKVLKSKGYYANKVTYKDGPDAVFDVRTGEQYTIENIEIIGYDDLSAVPLKQSNILDAKTVLDAENTLFKAISRAECFYQLSVNHEVILNHAQRTAHVTFIVEGNDDAKFGQTDFSGADKIKRKYLSRFLTYKEGDCWNINKIEAAKAGLLETGLLSSVVINLPETLPDSKIVPVQITLKERAARKIRLGSKYSTSEGAGVSAEWRHNNYLGAGEEVSVAAKVSTLLQSLGVNFIKPFFLSKKQSLHSSVAAERKETDAFEETSLNFESSIKRKLSKNWSGNLGAAFEAFKIIEDMDEEETFGLVSLPSRLNFDNRDNPLDPHKGYSFAFGLEPFVDVFGEADPFLKSRITGTTYFDLSSSRYDHVLALRGSYGSILGSGTDDIPASKRFYSGGGGSIRGFGFQEAGPVDTDDDPLGGRSLVEATAELRLKFTDTIGGVAFVDAGGVYDDVVPNFNEGIFVGAGVGARYYTSFGPIRFDVAAPFNKKDRADQGFQIYISIGQAF